MGHPVQGGERSRKYCFRPFRGAGLNTFFFLFRFVDGGLPETYRHGTPVLFLRGGKDGTSTKVGMRETRRLYPAAKIITYEDAAHWVMIEKKEAVTRDVLKWLCEVGL